MNPFKRLLLSSCVFITMNVVAVEGMWLPEQMPSLKKDLQAHGLELAPEQLSSLDKFPMNAIVSLGGCTASFVSPNGLIVTNHHCIYGDLQYNSTPEENLIEKGFLAKSMAEERPAAPGRRVWVTESVTNISQVMKSGLDKLSGRALLDELERRTKSQIAQCEDEFHRCRVFEFYGGAEYYLLRQLELKDLRIVYAPAEAIGKFGGDIDNWMWPRHTGDFAFYRAYIGKDGKPATYNKENVPYKPKGFLPLSKQGIAPGDFVMVAGYPGRTYRHKISTEVAYRFEKYYPRTQKVLADLARIIETIGAQKKEAAIKYASRLAGLNNYAKNFQGMMEGYARSHMLENRRKQETQLQQWLNTTPEMKPYRTALEDLKAALAQQHALQETDAWSSWLLGTGMLSTARNLYKWSLNQVKPDDQRELGFQVRDRERWEGYLRSLERRFDIDVESANFRYFLEKLFASENQEIRNIVKIVTGNAKNVDEAVDYFKRIHGDSVLSEPETRLALLDKKPDFFEKSSDPLLSLAVRLYPILKAREDRFKEINGKVKKARARFMEAKLAYFEAQGRPMYDDANSSLRITYGNVQGYPALGQQKPRDGVACDNNGCRYTPFTTATGIVAKDTGKKPFNVPPVERQLIEKRDFGAYEAKFLDDLPVNFLSDVDTTGGNSGSPTMNGKGELVGLLFDGTYDTLNADWEYTDNTRSIHVDVRYMLWVMEKIDHADNLLKELVIH